MDTINTLIIEDEINAAENLQKLLGELDSSIVIQNHLTSCKEAIQWLDKNPPPDLLFMDIELTDGQSFEILQKTNTQAPLIFTTAYNNFAIRAFDLNSVDYLLKPIEKERLAKALDKFKQRNISPIHDVSALISLIEKKEYRSRFMVTSGERILLIESSDIAYFYGQDKYTYLHTYENQRQLIDESLKDLETTLNPDEFFRLNRQYIVHVKAIKEMYPYSKSRVRVMLDPPTNDQVIVSVDRSPLFKKWLQR